MRKQSSAAELEDTYEAVKLVQLTDCSRNSRDGGTPESIKFTASTDVSECRRALCAGHGRL